MESDVCKLYSPKRLVQFQLFEKLTRANEFQIKLETVHCMITFTNSYCYTMRFNLTLLRLLTITDAIIVVTIVNMDVAFMKKVLKT